MRKLLNWLFQRPDYTIWVKCRADQAEWVKGLLTGHRIKPVKQNHTGLPDAVRSFGCKMRCLQAIAEFTEGRTLSAYDILTIYKSFAKKNDPDIMNSECRTGEKEHIIINNAFYRLRLDEKVTAKMVGSKNAKGETWQDQSGDFVVKHYAVNGSKNGHFVLCNSDGKEIFDPYDGKIERGGLIKTLFYRVFK